MIKKIFSGNHFLLALPWILFIVGIGLIVLPIYISEDESVKEASKIIGQTVLTGGVFAVLLKSIQFMGVFKEEISNLIYEPKFLRNRKDLKEIWEKTTLTLFDNKFPDISRKLNKDIQDIYLPTRDSFYYQNCEHEIILNKTENEYEVSLQHNVSIEVVTEKEKCEYQFYYAENAHYSIDEFKLDSEKVDLRSEKTEEKDGIKYEKYVVKLNGKRTHKIEKSTSSTRNIKTDPIFVFQASRIFNKLKIQIHHDDSLNVFLNKSGTLKDFRNKKNRNGFKEFYCEGLIYPEQGYTLLITQPLILEQNQFKPKLLKF